MLINENCIKCQIRKNLNAYPAGTSQDLVEIYQSRVRDILDRCYGLSTPQVAEKMYDLRRELFGADKDYSEIKSYYNRLMLSLLPHMEQKVQAADDPLAMAVQYAMVGNYIDFGAMESVDENELRAQLDQAADIVIDADVLDSFRKDILSAHHRMGYLKETNELICYDVINPIQYIFHEDTETFTLVYTEYDEDYEKFYKTALRDAEEAKKTREYGFDIMNHPNWFDASCIPWLSYDSMHLELPDVHMFFAPVINWGKYKEENSRLVMPVTVRLNHAIADGYLVANVFRLLEQEIEGFVEL